MWRPRSQSLHFFISHHMSWWEPQLFSQPCTLGRLTSLIKPLDCMFFDVGHNRLSIPSSSPSEVPIQRRQLAHRILGRHKRPLFWRMVKLFGFPI